MIGITKLYCGTVHPSDVLRYGRGPRKLPSKLLQFAPEKKPIVVWNCTRMCNLRCRHCYSAACAEPADDEMSTGEAKAMIDDLAAFGVPVLLFSGGEPLMRPDIMELISHARSTGLRTVLSSNGTLIDAHVAARLADVGLHYAGISLDGLEATNDAFRGVPGAFARTLQGIRRCREMGVKTGLRLTLNRRNVAELPAIFDLIEAEEIPRVCFYHLVGTGRAEDLGGDHLPHARTRAALDLMMDRTADLLARGRQVEVLTVDNHADGPYVYLRLLQEDPARAAEAMELLKMNAGNSTGIGIGCVSWNGDVLPDQFWRWRVLGNVRNCRFSEIWSDPQQPLLRKLRNRKQHLRCRCLRCRFLDVCNGNFRARAEAATGDPWGEDPACYLTDAEIALPAGEPAGEEAPS
ncbi:MAG: radical SAM protein [Phycisphaerae bacterium]